MVTWYAARVTHVAFRHRQLHELKIFRLIHLHHAATTKQVTGHHHVKDYEDFKYPDPKEYQLELWKIKPLQKEKVISLSDVIKDYLKPGHPLLPLRSENSNKLPENELPRYYIGEINTSKIYQTKSNKSKGRGSKEFHFRTDVDIDHFTHSLYKSYHFLSRKLNRSPIEIHIRHPIKKLKNSPNLNLDNFQRRKDALREQKTKFSEAIFKALHLWPTTILKAMPEGSNLTISPVSNHKDQVCWLMDLNGKNKNDLFLKKRSFHENRYQNCEGLPDKGLRRQVKRDIRKFRLQVRAEIETQKQEEKQPKKIDEAEITTKNEKTYFSQPTIDTLLEAEAGIVVPEKSNELPIKTPEKTKDYLGLKNFGPLVSQVEFKDIIESTGNLALEQLKILITNKASKKGISEVIQQCDLENLSHADKKKIYFISLVQIKERVAVIEKEQVLGPEKVKRENELILERTKNLYASQPDAKQLQEEIKRRLDTDLQKVIRRNKEKFSLELKKLNRRRLKLTEILGPNEKRELMVIEGGYNQIFYKSSKKLKKGYSWQSRGSSRVLRD